jgi:hypothetical protein
MDIKTVVPNIFNALLEISYEANYFKPNVVTSKVCLKV